MKRFSCRCGRALFFDSHACVGCGSAVGFDPAELEMRPLVPDAAGSLQDEHGQTYRRCANGGKHGVCNWLLQPDDENELCFACRFNRTIPNLTNPENLTRWRKLEVAKKRLLYTLLRLGLPLHNSGANGGIALSLIHI